MSFYFIPCVLHKLLRILTVFKVGAAVPHCSQEETEAWGAGGEVTCQSHTSQPWWSQVWELGLLTQPFPDTCTPSLPLSLPSFAAYRCLISKGWVCQSGGRRESCWERCTALVSWHFFWPALGSRTAHVKAQWICPINQLSDGHGVNGQWPAIQRVLGQGGETAWPPHKEGTW